MSGRFVNDDAKLRVGGRKAKKISPRELEDKILAEARKAMAAWGEDLDDYLEEESGAGALESAVFGMFTEGEVSTQLDKDNKYLLGFDNISADARDIPGGEKYLGLCTIGDFTFYGFITAGDCEEPAFALLYWDGKKLRMYIPTYGNYVNTINKCGIGTESWFDEEEYEDDYRARGAWNESMDLRGSNVDYLRIYDIERVDDDDMLPFNPSLREVSFFSDIERFDSSYRLTIQ